MPINIRKASVAKIVLLFAPIILLYCVLFLFTHSFHLILLPPKLLGFSNNQRCQLLSPTLHFAASPSIRSNLCSSHFGIYLTFFLFGLQLIIFSYKCPSGLPIISFCNHILFMRTHGVAKRSTPFVASLSCYWYPLVIAEFKEKKCFQLCNSKDTYEL